MRTPQLLERYTFDKFVVGPTNQFAHAAARMVAEAPASRWNPLFIYGGVGLGKTHLLQAIGHEIHLQHPEWAVCFITGEKFVTDFIGSMMSQKRSSRRQLDGGLPRPLPDGARRAARRRRPVPRRQGQHAGRVLPHVQRAPRDAQADRARLRKLPAEITDIADRLRTRFAWGLLADIEPPELEVRIAILKRKAALDEASTFPTTSRSTSPRHQEQRPRARGRAHSPGRVRLASKRPSPGVRPGDAAELHVASAPRELITVEAIIKRSRATTASSRRHQGPQRHRAVAHPAPSRCTWRASTPR